jgi:cyclic beta-1,2-glucan synthetase
MFRRPILAALLFLAGPMVRAEADLRWAGAAEQGVFTAGAGAASLTTGDSAPRLHFSLTPGDAVGAWFKSFPTVLSAGSFDAGEIRLRVDLPPAVGHLPAAVELKGAAGLQRVALRLRPGDNEFRFPLEWRQCGALHELVFILQHPGGAESWAGTVQIDGRLIHEPEWQRQLARPGVAIAALAALAALLCLPLPLAALVTARGLVKDVARGLAALLVMAALLITQAPALSVVGAPGLWRLVAALAGGLAAALLSWAATPDRPRVHELFRNTFLPGLLLLAASEAPIWSLPAGWSDLLRLNATGAALLFVLYHVVHAFQSITARRGIPAAAAWTITLLPFVSGLLLALPQHDLMRQVTAGGPVWLGRAVTLTALNVLAALACGGLAGRPGIGGPRGFQALATVGVAVALAPRLADAGSGAWAIVLPLQPLAALVGTVLSQGALWAEVFLITGMLLDALGGQAPTASALRQHARTGFRRAAIFGAVLMGLVQLVAHVPALIPAPPLFVLLVGGALLMPLGKTIVESFDGSAPFAQRLLRHYRDRILLVRGALGAALVALAVAVEFRALPTPERAGWGFAAGALVYAGVSLVRDLRLWIGGHGRVQGLRLYACEVLLGGCAGAALGFYFDTTQVPLVLAKLRQYASYAHAPTPYEIYPLFSKWGFLRLGDHTGGARLLFNEALAGVISWGLAAWLFALNRSFLQAALDRDRGPLRRLFSRGGLQELAPARCTSCAGASGWPRSSSPSCARSAPPPGTIRTGRCAPSSRPCRRCAWTSRPSPCGASTCSCGCWPATPSAC